MSVKQLSVFAENKSGSLCFYIGNRFAIFFLFALLIFYKDLHTIFLIRFRTGTSDHSLKSGAVAVSKMSVTFLSGAFVARVPTTAPMNPAMNPGTSS